MNREKTQRPRVAPLSVAVCLMAWASLPTLAQDPLVLTLDGTCPGSVTLRGVGEPDGSIGVGAALAEGSFQVPGGACVGVALDLADPIPVVSLPTDSTGVGSVDLDLPASACSGYLQALDLTSCATSGVVPLASSSPAVRIMPLGDSITQGGDDGVASYRYDLWYSLLAEGRSVDFVGSRITVNGGDDGPGGFIPDNSVYTGYYTSFDRDHEGYWGYRTDEVLPLVVGATLGGQPDITLLKLGTNDIGQSSASGVDSAAATLPQIIGNLRSVRPAIQILLAQVIPLAPGAYNEGDQWVDELNLAIADVAAATDSAASRVLLVDQFSGFVIATDLLGDGIHPNQAGEQKIAANWLTALQPLLDTPVLPPAEPTVILTNGSFESLALSDGEIEATPGAVDGWTYRRSFEISAGVYNPGDDTYLGAAGDGVPMGGDGPAVAYLYANNTLSQEAALIQTLATTLEPDTFYELTVAVGNRLGSNPYGSSYGGYRIELLAGNDPIVEQSDQIVPLEGTFEDVTLSVDSAALDTELQGRALTLRLSMTGTGAFDSTDFDNVRLTAVP